MQSLTSISNPFEGSQGPSGGKYLSVVPLCKTCLEFLTTGGKTLRNGPGASLALIEIPGPRVVPVAPLCLTAENQLDQPSTHGGGGDEDGAEEQLFVGHGVGAARQRDAHVAAEDAASRRTHERVQHVHEPDHCNTTNSPRPWEPWIRSATQPHTRALRIRCDHSIKGVDLATTWAQETYQSSDFSSDCKTAGRRVGSNTRMMKSPSCETLPPIL